MRHFGVGPSDNATPDVNRRNSGADPRFAFQNVPSALGTPNRSRETVLVVDENKPGRRGVAPAPEREIEVGGRRAPGEGRDEERRVARGDEASRERLRPGFSGGDHVVAPGGGG